MLFDLEVNGHHASYINFLIKYYLEENLNCSLFIVVSPGFMQKHREVVDVDHEGFNRVNFVPISQTEQQYWEASRFRVVRTFRQWNILCWYSKKLSIDHCVVMYIDHILQLPLALGLNCPCNISGIYFRPTFHYKNFQQSSSSTKDALRSWRQKLLIKSAIRNPKLIKLFSLDPFVIQEINTIDNRSIAVALPDPVLLGVEQTLPDEAIKEALGIGKGRLVFLFFGAISRRKGIFQLLAALHFIPKEIAQRISLLIIGEVEKDRALMSECLNEVREKIPIQIIFRDEFVPENEVVNYFSVANVVLAPYQKHVGMSGVLVLAAAFGKPVLASDYGIVGEMTRRYSLGIAVNTLIPKEISNGIIRFLTEPVDHLYNHASMQQFAEQNRACKFANCIFEGILD
jgi:glycosyltransferase involved in cell wall biosynthesis